VSQFPLKLTIDIACHKNYWHFLQNHIQHTTLKPTLLISSCSIIPPISLPTSLGCFYVYKIILIMFFLSLFFSMNPINNYISYFYYCKIYHGNSWRNNIFEKTLKFVIFFHVSMHHHLQDPQFRWSLLGINCTRQAFLVYGTVASKVYTTPRELFNLKIKEIRKRTVNNFFLSYHRCVPNIFIHLN